jgi:hypothetical protein
MTTTTTEERYRTFMIDFEESALWRYIHEDSTTDSYPEAWGAPHVGDITEDEIYELYPDMPNIPYGELRKWWRLYKPIGELYQEFIFEGEEPSDKELLIYFIMAWE